MAERLLPTLIFVVTFLSTFIFLISAMPSAFLYAGKSYMNYTYPDYFDKTDIENIAYFQNNTIDRGYSATLNFKSEINFKFHVYWEDLPFGNHLHFWHITWEWWVFFVEHQMDVEDGDKYLTKSEAIENWDSEVNASIFYPISCNHISVKVWLTDTNSSRNDISEAWDDGSLHIGMGFGFDDITTILNAWDIVGRLLTFQSLDLGVPIFLNALIAIPIWTCIAFLVYKLILMAIPFVGGS